MADLNTTVPNGTGNFSSFTMPAGNHAFVSVSGAMVAFQAFDGEGQIGAYLGFDRRDRVEKLIAAGDTLDGGGCTG